LYSNIRLVCIYFYFINISFTSWRLVLLVKKTGDIPEVYRVHLAINKWRTHNNTYKTVSNRSTTLCCIYLIYHLMLFSPCRWSLVIIPPLPEGEGGILFYLCPSIQDIFRHIFLSNCRKFIEYISPSTNGEPTNVTVNGVRYPLYW
jgi:hypothetical protein